MLAQGRGVSKPARGRDGLDVQVAGLEQCLRRTDALLNHPAHRARPGLGDEVAGKGAWAHVRVSRHPLERQGLIQVVHDPGPRVAEPAVLQGRHRPLDELSLPAGAVGGHDHAARREIGDREAVVAPDEVQAQVESGGEARRREHRAVLDVEGVGVDIDLGVPGRQPGGVRAVGRGATAVEYAGGGEGEGARADRGDPGAAAGRCGDQLAQRAVDDQAVVGRAGNDDGVRPAARSPVRRRA